MFLCLSACATHFEVRIGFVSETLWSTSLRDLDVGFADLYIKNEWDKRPRLKMAEPQEYMKLISRYIVILNRKSDATSKISNMEPVESIAELLKLVII